MINRAFRFTSLARTATGSAETIQHNLGAVPSVVIINEHSAAATKTHGTHTASTIVVTVTQGVVYDVIAGFVKE